MNDVTVIFQEQQIKDKLKERGFRETHENIDTVEGSIRKCISESQLVTWFIQRAITCSKENLTKVLEE